MGGNSGAAPDLPPEGAVTRASRKYAFAILDVREAEKSLAAHAVKQCAASAWNPEVPLPGFG